MIIISHRANLNGTDPLTENTVAQIKKVLAMGFHVEVDVWFVDGKLCAGHDYAGEEVLDLIYNKNIYWHCKNFEAAKMLWGTGLKYFIHDKDFASFTSDDFLWTNQKYPMSYRSIAVLPELIPDWDVSKAYGICTDYPLKYQKLYGSF